MSSIYLPITEPNEIDLLVRELPLAVDKAHFVQFVRGFPRRYLVNTARFEIVKHYLLAENLGGGNSISSLYRENNLWKLALITRDRNYLFSRIAGTLACYGMNISSAEAFANANSLVLDTFLISDPQSRLTSPNDRGSFQHLVEEVIEGERDIDQLIREHQAEVPFADYEPVEITFDNESHPTNTRIHLKCRDHIGLAYLLSDCLSRTGHSIEMAYIKTVGDYSEEDYYVTFEDQKLQPEDQESLRWKLEHLGDRFA